MAYKSILLFLLIISVSCTKQKEFSIEVITQHDNTERERRKVADPFISNPFTNDELNKVRSLVKIAIKNQINQNIQLVTRYDLLALNYDGYLNGRFMKGFALTDIYERNDIKYNEIFYTYLVYDNEFDSAFYKTPIVFDVNKPKKAKWLVTKFIKDKDKKIVFDSYKFEE